MPIGSVTRGTTGTNRLRRVDRWITQLPPFRSEPAPLVVDFGFG
ncbi:MAG: class I SAM-dependent methyltransferase, partial [Microbacteriaceae bacterium]|nr:class I SAM-dependent methyltransferase [Microbacteriaceae bacterium]